MYDPIEIISPRWMIESKNLEASSPYISANHSLRRKSTTDLYLLGLYIHAYIHTGAVNISRKRDQPIGPVRNTDPWPKDFGL